MSDPAEQEAYRQIGRQIAVHLQQQPLASFPPRQWQGILADLAGGHSDLKTPLWDLTQRPLFANLLQQKDRAHRAIAREALLQQLRSMFAPPVVEALREVLDGLIAARQGEHSDASTRQAAPQLPPQPEPRSSPDTPEADPGGSVSDDGSAAPAVSRLSRVLAPWILENRRRLLLAALTSLGLLGGVIALSGPWRCSLPGLCRPVSLTAEPQRTLARAQQLAQQLKAARTLGSYQELTETLDRELESLKTAPLTAEQAGRYKKLQSMAAAARTTAATEAGISRKLDQVSGWLRAAPQLEAPSSAEARARARSALMAVGPTRFSQQRLQSLRDSLRTPDQLSAKPAEKAAADSAPDPAAPVGADPNPATPRATASGAERRVSRPAAPRWGSESPAMPAPAPRLRPVDPVPPASPSPESAIASPVTPMIEAPTYSRGEYRLPEKWEQRRRRRREIMNQYENAGE